jgi:membrane-associated phospholipid phosphatase
MKRVLRGLRRIGLRGILIFVLVVALFTGKDTEKLGDSFQIALPVLALGCALADGSAVRLVGRYILLETLIKGPKNALGMHPINVRPNGGDKGFPSGHTAVAVFGSTALVQSCLQGSPAAQAVAIITAGFVGASRVEADKHFVWQVLAGAILGWLVQALTLSAFDRFVARIWRAISGVFVRREKE